MLGTSYFLHSAFYILIYLINFWCRSWPSKTLSAFAASVQRQATGTARKSDNNFKDKNQGTSNVIEYLAVW